MAKKLQADEIQWTLVLDAKGVQSELYTLSSATQQLEKNNSDLEEQLKAVRKQMNEAEKAMQKLEEKGQTTSKTYERAKIAFDQAGEEMVKLTKDIDSNKRAIDENNKKAEQLTKTLKVEDMTMNQLRSRAKELEIQLHKTSQSTDPTAYNALKKQLDEVKNRMGELKKGSDDAGKSFKGFSSNIGGALAVFAGNMMTKAVEGIGRLIEKAKEWVLEGLSVSRSAEGVLRAFEALNQPGLLEKLREQTRGTIGDFELMQATVKADKYRIPIQEVGNLLEFAGRRAIDMGKDVDDFQKRIIEGTGKESKKILDDIGLSSTEISKAIAKEGTFAKGVIAVVNEELAKQGPLALLGADEAEKASVKWANAQGEVGDQLLWIDKIHSKLSAKVADSVSSFATKQLPGLMQKLIDLYNWFVDFYNNSLLLRATIEAINLHFKTMYYLAKFFFDFAIDSAQLLGNTLKAAFTLDWDLLKKSFEDYYKNAAKTGQQIKEGALADLKSGIENTANNRLEKYTPTPTAAVTPTGTRSSLTTDPTEQELREAIQKQKKDQDLELEALETKHQEAITKIKKDYQQGFIKSESEFNQKTFAANQANFLLRENILEKFVENTKDAELKSSREKQLADLRNKQLDEEIKFRAKLEKIILDANPEEKEKRDYNNRLRDVGLFGIEKEKMTVEQLAALELLEKQHEDNLLKIRKDRKSKQRATEKEKFDEDFKFRRAQFDRELEQLQNEINLRNAVIEHSYSYSSSLFGRDFGEAILGDTIEQQAFQKKVDVHNQELQMIRERIDARKAAGEEYKDLQQAELNAEDKLMNEHKSRLADFAKRYSDFGDTMGQVLGDVLTGQKSALEAFGGFVIDILLDTLASIIQAKIAEATAVAIAEQAKAAAISAALPDSVLTFGASGAARTAIIGGIIMGALAASKAALKNMLSSSTKSSTGSSSSNSTAYQRVPQRASGKYDVIGEDDGRLYRDIPYAGIAKTGIVTQPTLMGERGSELIISSPDFKALQKHINYPVVIEALNDARTGRVPQRASGKYDVIGNNTTSALPDLSQINDTMKGVEELLQDLKKNKIKADINYRSLESATDKNNQVKNLAAR